MTTNHSNDRVIDHVSENTSPSLADTYDNKSDCILLIVKTDTKYQNAVPSVPSVNYVLRAPIFLNSRNFGMKRDTTKKLKSNS